jgi:glycosyltransferase involved in cell wall biosynthesis
LNVVHLITTIERGGAETQLLTLVTEQIRQGKKVKVIYLKGTPALEAEFLAAGAEVVAALANRNLLFQLINLKRRIGSDFQIVHCHLPRAELLAACAMIHPFVVSRHNAEKFFPSAPKSISRKLSRFVVHRASACVAISSAVKDFLISEKEVSVGYEINVVHYGIEISKFFSSSRRPFLKDNIRIGTISRLVPQKNLKLLLSGFQNLCESKPESTLQIVGKGILEKELKKFAEELKIQSKLTWTTEVSNVPEFFQEIDIFCLTSNYEGFGLVLLESMAAGVPIISKANDATLEVLGKNYPYFLHDDSPKSLSESVLRLGNDEELERIRLMNLEKLENFTTSRMEMKISDIYNLS